MNKPAPAGTQSILRGVALLKALAASTVPMELPELTAAVGLARTTTHRLLAALESEGLVVRDGVSGAYRLGPGAIAIGAAAIRVNPLRTIVRPHLQRLAQSTGETATLEVLAGGEMLIVDEVAGAEIMSVAASLGTSWAIHATSTGKALLSALPVEEMAGLVRGRLERYTPQTVRSRAALEDNLAEVRKAGYARAVDELVEGFSAVGVAILGADGRPRGAIAVGGPTSRLRGQRLRRTANDLREAAAAISAALGHDRGSTD